MGTEIRTWQIVNGKLASIDTTLAAQGRTEPYDLEPWLASNPEIIGADIVVIGRQVKTKSGLIGNLIVNAFAGKFGGDGKSKGPVNPRRSPLGTLPALPFEIVAAQ